MSMRLYADLHRDEVVGMVLVDPSTRDFAPPRAAWTADERQRADAEHAEGERHAKTCIAAARAGFVAGSKAFDECIDDAPNPRYSAAINAVYSRLQRTPSFLEARWSEDVAFDTSSADQVRAARRGYGAMPLVVLTQSEAAADPANSDFVRAHDAIAALSSRGVNRIVPESSHSIFFDQPQAVIDAIREVLAATKSAAH
jgi:pimeloyl-ACP methyl ester carboxylesterase